MFQSGTDNEIIVSLLSADQAVQLAGSRIEKITNVWFSYKTEKHCHFKHHVQGAVTPGLRV